MAVLRLITSSNLVDCKTGRSAGLAPLRISAGILADLTKHVRNAGSVTHQAADLGVVAHGEHRGDHMARGERGELHTPAVIEPIGADKERVGPLTRKRCENRLDLAAGSGVEDLDFQSERGSGRIHVSQGSVRHLEDWPD